jgi:hypothetical protein
MAQPFPNADYPTAYDEDDFLKSGAAPVNEGGAGTDERQSVYQDGTGGTFSLIYSGQETDEIPYDVEDDAAVAAAVVIDFDTIPVEDNTITLGGREYTWKDGVTTVADTIDIGASLAEAKVNLVAAMDLSGTAGTDYGSLTTVNLHGRFSTFIVDASTFTAILPGLDGNDIASIMTMAGTSSFAAATLLLGLDSIESALQAISTITDVTVTGTGTAADPWLVTFVDPGDEDIAMMTAGTDSLTGETLGVVIAELVSGREPLEVDDVESGQGPL